MVRLIGEPFIEGKLSFSICIADYREKARPSIILSTEFLVCTFKMEDLEVLFILLLFVTLPAEELLTERLKSFSDIGGSYISLMLRTTPSILKGSYPGPAGSSLS